MSTDGSYKGIANTTMKNDKLGQELFDIKSILNKVENGNTTEPDIPTKSSTEILSELFEAFNAEPPEIPDRKEQVTENRTSNEGDKKAGDDESCIKNKKNKKSKKKHKRKDKKHKKKSKSSKKQGSSDESNDGRKKHKHPSDRKKKKHTDVQVKESEVKIMPALEPVSVKITTDGDNNVKRTVECAVNEQTPQKDIVKPEELCQKKPCEDEKPNTKVKEEAVPVTTSQTKLPTDIKSKPGKIVIKNLKFSSVFEETVRQVEEQAKLKAERYEEGEISEDSSENKEETQLDDDMLELTPERDNNQEKKERRKHCHKHNTEEKYHHHHHRHHHKSRSQSREKKDPNPVKDHSRQHSKECSHGKKTSEKNLNQYEDRSCSAENHCKKRSHSRDSGGGSKKRSKRSHSRHNSVSKDKSKCSKHSCSKRRSKSLERSNKSKHSRSRSVSRHRSGSDPYSKKSERSKHSRSRSRSRHRSESTNRSNKKRVRRSRSHSLSRHRSESTGRSDKSKRSRRSRSRDSAGHIDKQKLLEIARKNAMNLLKQGVLPSSVVTQDKVVAIKAGGKSVAELTDFCKQLSKKEAMGQVSTDSEGEDHHSSGSDTERPFHHPFQIKERPSSIVMNIRNSVQLPLKTLQEKTAEQSKQLRIQFPVSSGQQHRKSENEWVPVSPKKEEPTAQVPVKVAEARPVAETASQVFPAILNTEGLDIGSIVSQRLTAMRKLQENPNDVQALSEMYRAQKDMQMWAESKQQPGQFTGSTGARVLSAAELSSGFQAWAKKDQLTTASPVSGGMGMALLQKMGWRPGEGLGKNKEGTLEPLKLEIKMDKKGLVSQEELGRRPVPPIPQIPTTKTLVGKHPVSLLVEFCSKRRWGVPQFELCFECGPDHRKNFLFKVRVNGNEYKPSVASPNKKQAKAEAATICLQVLGVLPP